MSENPSPAPPQLKRERYLIDRGLQLGVAVPLLAIPVVTAVAHVAALYLMPGETALKAMSAVETRSLFLEASIAYYAIAAVALGSVAVFLTHRIAGPAVAIERALRALERGEYHQRLGLRPGDSLKTLAGAVTDLRGRLKEDEEQRRQVLVELASSLERGDLASARELLARLGSPGEASAPSSAAVNA